MLRGCIERVSVERVKLIGSIEWVRSIRVLRGWVLIGCIERVSVDRVD